VCVRVRTKCGGHVMSAPSGVFTAGLRQGELVLCKSNYFVSVGMYIYCTGVFSECIALATHIIINELIKCILSLLEGSIETQ